VSTVHDRPFFIPAQTPGEAIARIYGLTGAPSQGRGEKRALVALRDALSLDVDVVRTNALLGQRLAESLKVDWVWDEHTRLNKVTLSGLNVLLEGALDARQEGRLASVRDGVPDTLAGPEWAVFEPAVSKIEAVTRIARLTDAPEEWLGPGSKEHKSVLINLADRLLPGAALDRTSKTRLGRSIANELGVSWTDACYSTGETISLKGLNTVLAGAERRMGRLGTTAVDLLASPEAEGQALAAALYDGWKAEPWDGRECVEWMRREGARGANDNEWQGFYFEARGRELLNQAFRPNPRPVEVRFANTVFDYSLNHVWDLKAHTAQQWSSERQAAVRKPGTAMLNDEDAFRRCVATQGLGFLVLSGGALMDEDGTFVEWHRDFKRAQGVKSAQSNSQKSRVRKARFAPLSVEAFWIADLNAMDAAILAGALSVKPQGRQAPRHEATAGDSRPDKFHLHFAAARERLRVGGHDWSYRSSWHA